MKKMLLLLSFFAVLSSCTCVFCNEDDNIPFDLLIYGEWELEAVLADSGDGSGTFQPASGKTLQFTDQGVVNCNVSFCFGSLTQATSSGTFDISTTTIDVDNCMGTYVLTNANTLEVSHFCIEPCGERYVRVN
ncbi:hypothetical protein [Nonlabens sp.]|jgi:hypothetical protein|uniref:hypothetical protein n=1 Tax=Nonlabens sp. TaxID=1888209 RepID=UPI003F69B452